MFCIVPAGNRIPDHPACILVSMPTSTIKTCTCILCLIPLTKNIDYMHQFYWWITAVTTAVVSRVTSSDIGNNQSAVRTTDYNTWVLRCSLDCVQIQSSAIFFPPDSKSVCIICCNNTKIYEQHLTIKQHNTTNTVYQLILHKKITRFTQQCYIIKNITIVWEGKSTYTHRQIYISYFGWKISKKQPTW